MNLSPGVRLFLRDAVEAAIAALLSLTITMPANIDEAKRTLVIIAFAVGSAIIAVARRELLPLVLEWISPKP